MGSTGLMRIMDLHYQMTKQGGRTSQAKLTLRSFLITLTGVLTLPTIG